MMILAVVFTMFEPTPAKARAAAIARADTVMYEAKRTGRERVVAVDADTAAHAKPVDGRVAQRLVSVG